MYFKRFLSAPVFMAAPSHSKLLFLGYYLISSLALIFWLQWGSVHGSIPVLDHLTLYWDGR